MTMTREQLLVELDKLAAAGDEKAVEQFLIDHYQELPDDVKGTLLLSVYTDALQKEADEARIVEVQEKGLAALDALAAMKDPENPTT